MRMRLAYATLDWPDTQVLFGQFWDIWAPVPGNTLDFRQAGPDGAAANPRVPQVRITQKFNLSDSNMIKLAVAVQNPSQNAPEGVTPSTPYGPSVPTANDPSLGTINSYGQAPNAGFQLSFISKALGAAPGFWGMPMKPLEIGLFGIVGKQKFSPYTVGASPTIYRDKDATVSGLGAFAFVPVLKSSDGKSRAMTASLEAQAYTGKGLAVQGVNTAQLSGAPGMKEMPKALGVLTQGVLYPTQEWGVTAGYGYRSVIGSAPRDRGTERNQYLAFVNTAYDFNAAVRVAAEYEHAKSNFFGTPTTGGNVGATADNGQINTFRLCAMYFF
ncbi:MAG TPA: hypothetical protein HPP97_03040 [Desulfuromonadales bacterium]|nr:hypothetical protein [Desulfuromonadales bacterium]